MNPIIPSPSFPTSFKVKSPKGSVGKFLPSEAQLVLRGFWAKNAGVSTKSNEPKHLQVAAPETCKAFLDWGTKWPKWMLILDVDSSWSWWWWWWWWWWMMRCLLVFSLQVGPVPCLSTYVDEIKSWVLKGSAESKICAERQQQIPPGKAICRDLLSFHEVASLLSSSLNQNTLLFVLWWQETQLNGVVALASGPSNRNQTATACEPHLKALKGLPASAAVIGWSIVPSLLWLFGLPLLWETFPSLTPIYELQCGI